MQRRTDYMKHMYVRVQENSKSKLKYDKNNKQQTRGKIQRQTKHKANITDASPNLDTTKNHVRCSV